MEVKILIAFVFATFAAAAPATETSQAAAQVTGAPGIPDSSGDVSKDPNFDGALSTLLQNLGHLTSL
jgi:hypothetical protein